MKKPSDDINKSSPPGPFMVNLVDGKPQVYPVPASWEDKRNELDRLETIWDCGPVGYEWETFDQVRARFQLLIGDPARTDRVILLDQPIELGGNLLLVEGAFGQIEVESPAAVANGSAGHTGRNHGAKKVHERVHAHEAMTALPVDAGLQLLPNQIGPDLGIGNMNDVPGHVVLTGIDDADLAAVLKTQNAGIPGLATAHRIEDRSIQSDSRFVNGRDPGLALLHVGVLTKDLLGHASPSSWDVSFSTYSAARRNVSAGTAPETM